MSDLCELETKMKTLSRYALTTFLAILGGAFTYDYIFNGMHIFDLMLAIWLIIYAVVCWRSR